VTLSAPIDLIAKGFKSSAILYDDARHT